MKNAKSISFALVLVLLAALLTGCAAPSAGSGTISFTDMKDREITLDAPATKVVALTAADCEILCALGAEETLVGRGEYCDWPAEITEVPSVESGSETNIEQIISLAPQVVLMGTMAQTTEQVQQLENAGITVITSDATNLDGVYYAIDMIGKVIGKSDEAAALVSDMKATFADISSKSAGEGKTVYFEVSPLQYGLWAAGAGTFMDEIATMLGLKNAFADVSGWAEVSEEQVLERNPDYIVTVSMYYGEGPTPTDEILARAGWENVSAVKNQAILNLQNNELSRPGPRLADGAQALYDFICR